MSKKLKNFINGEWIESKTDKYENVYNPATKEVLAQVPITTTKDFEEAVQTAKAAPEKWAKVSVARRARVLFRYHNLLEEHREELAKLITQEDGKSFGEALGEVGRGIENVEFAAGAPTLMMGDSLATIATDVEATNYR